MMVKLVAGVMAISIAIGVQSISAEQSQEVLEKVVPVLNEIGAAERLRQQEIQNLVCEAEDIPVSQCPIVPPWVPFEIIPLIGGNESP